jgi:tRNA-modifying protein YgfZ
VFEILINRSIVEINGQSPSSFLQKLTTNDLIKNKYCYTFLLSNQGRYLFDFFVYNLNDETILIDIDESLAHKLISKLNFYKLRTNVTITTNVNYSIIYSQMELFDNILCSNQDPRSSLMGFRSIALKETFTPSTASFNNNLYLNDKYNYTIPDGHIDLISDKSIPIEYGADELNSISYSKGCYVGQEVISRTKYQGVVRKKIFQIIAAEDLNVEDRAEVKSGDAVLGVCCSYYKNTGIALIREENLKNIQNDPITIGNIPVELVIPKWRQV